MRGFVFLCLLVFSGVAHAQKLRIAVTIPYIQDLLTNITCANSNFNVTTLVQQEVDPHTFAFSPAQRLVMAQAQVLIQVGSGLEIWMNKVHATTQQESIVLTEGMTLDRLEDTTEQTPHADVYEFDPHIWHSPKRTKQAVQKIADRLVVLSPANSAQIKQCTASYLKKIDDEVTRLRREVFTLPLESRVLPTNHDAFGYFADEFGFRVVSILGFSDEAPPTVQQIKSMIEQIRKQKIKVVFLEFTGNMKALESVAKETGVRVGGKLYGDTLGPKGSGAETVLGMWNTNIKTLVESLK